MAPPIALPSSTSNRSESSSPSKLRNSDLQSTNPVDLDRRVQKSKDDQKQEQEEVEEGQINEDEQINMNTDTQSTGSNQIYSDQLRIPRRSQRHMQQMPLAAQSHLPPVTASTTEILAASIKKSSNHQSPLSSTPTVKTNLLEGKDDINREVEEETEEDEEEEDSDSVKSTDSKSLKESNAARKLNNKAIHQCQECGKTYKHRNCLIKHHWEHNSQWQSTKRWCQTKHQQVQLMEAAHVLAEMCLPMDQRSMLELTTLPSYSPKTSIREDPSSSKMHMMTPIGMMRPVSVHAQWQAQQMQSNASIPRHGIPLPIHPDSRPAVWPANAANAAMSPCRGGGVPSSVAPPVYHTEAASAAIPNRNPNGNGDSARQY